MPPPTYGNAAWRCGTSNTAGWATAAAIRIPSATSPKESTSCAWSRRGIELDLKHVVLVGHSAGGDLALWAAARGHLPATSPLASPAKPMAFAGVVTLGGIDDLETYRRAGPEACGGRTTIDNLTHGHPPRANPYVDTSPAALLPIGVPQTIISGADDLIVPPIFGGVYLAKAKAAGDAVEAVTIPGAGHFDLIDPLADAWRRVEPIIAAKAR